MKISRFLKKLDFGLFDYLNCTFGALCLACSADQTFAGFRGDGFAVFYFVDADWACVNTGFASGAFRVDNDFYHFGFTSRLKQPKAIG